MSAPASEPVPVSRVSGQARNLQPHHQACFAECDFTEQFLKPIPAGRLRSRLAEVAVDYVDTLERPAQCNGAITQGILALRALRILHNLTRCGLSNVEIRIVCKMLWSNF